MQRACGAARDATTDAQGISILCPLGFSLLVVPLTIRGLHVEIFDSYYWGLQVTSSLIFAESFARMCFADKIPARWLGLGVSAGAPSVEALTNAICSCY